MVKVASQCLLATAAQNIKKIALILTKEPTTGRLKNGNLPSTPIKIIKNQKPLSKTKPRQK